VSYFGSSVASNYVDQPAATLIQLKEIQSTTSLTGAGITVAIIDTGIDASHPALRDVLLPGFDFITNMAGASELEDLDPATAAALTQSSTSILDGQHLVQLNSATVAILSQSSTSILDGLPRAFGHGTMTAGLVHLIAPGAKIMPLKAFAADGSSDLFNVIRAIYYAVDHGANVISMSFEIAQNSSALENAIEYAANKKVTIVAAAGNDGQKMLVYPAAFGAVIGVGSTDNEDAKSSFSNFGTNGVYVAAPGEGVITTYPGGLYAAGWGTSFSTPLVAGEAALILETRPDSSPGDVRNSISRAQSVQEMGHGRIDLYEALTKDSSGTSGSHGRGTNSDDTGGSASGGSTIAP
jgi:subtilisin family serine protease